MTTQSPPPPISPSVRAALSPTPLPPLPPQSASLPVRVDDAAKPQIALMSRDTPQITFNIQSATVQIAPSEAPAPVKWVAGHNLPDHSVYTGGLFGQIPYGSGTKVFVGDPTAGAPQIYIGEFLDGLQHGHGFARWANGSTYEGQWERGLRHGKGTLLGGDYQSYVGDWALDKMQGRGTITFLNNTVYIGEVVDSKPDGLGRYFELLLSHEGHWKKGIKHGQGTERVMELGASKGSWKNGEKDGAHEYTPPLQSAVKVTYRSGSDVTPLCRKCCNCCYIYLGCC